MNKKGRLPEFDLLRIFAAFLVVVLHVAGSQFYSVPYDSSHWAAMNLYDAFCRCAVPLFFMLSGAFMLQKEIPLKKLLAGKVLPLAVIYLFWSVAYALFAVWEDPAVTLTLKNWAALAAKGYLHLWFLPAMIGLYLLQPVLYALVHHNEGKTAVYYGGLFAIFGVLRPTLLFLLQGKEQAVLLVRKIPVELMSHAGYMVLGYLLVTRWNCGGKKRWYALGYIAASLTIAAAAYADAFHTEKVSTLFYDYFALPVGVAAVCAFCWFRNLSVEKERLWLTRCSALTMGVYLIHLMVLGFLRIRWGVTSLFVHPALGVPLLSLGVFGASALIAWGLSKLPFLKYLIKG